MCTEEWRIFGGLEKGKPRPKLAVEDVEEDDNNEDDSEATEDKEGA